MVSQQEPQNSSPQGHTVPENSAPPQSHFKSLVQPPPVPLFRFEAAFSQGLRPPYFLCYQVCFLLTPSTAGTVLPSFPGLNLQTTNIFPLGQWYQRSYQPPRSASPDTWQLLIIRHTPFNCYLPDRHVAAMALIVGQRGDYKGRL